MWHGKWRFIVASYAPLIGCVDPLPSSPSHRPFALSLRVDARAETARGGPLLLLFERRSSWSEISGFSHDNTLQPDEPFFARVECVRRFRKSSLLVDRPESLSLRTCKLFFQRERRWMNKLLFLTSSPLRIIDLATSPSYLGPSEVKHNVSNTLSFDFAIR